MFRFRILIALLILTLPIGWFVHTWMLDDNPLDPPRIRPWETAVQAAERYLIAELALAQRAFDAGITFSMKFARREEIVAADFALGDVAAELFAPDRKKPHQRFADTPQGAYLSEQDKVYLDRRHDILFAELQAHMRRGVEQLRAELIRAGESDPSRDIPGFGSVGDAFAFYPANARLVQLVSDEDWSRLGRDVREAIEKETAEVRAAFLSFTNKPVSSPAVLELRHRITSVWVQSRRSGLSQKISSAPFEQYVRSLMAVSAFENDELTRLFHIVVPKADHDRIRQLYRNALQAPN